MGKPDGAMFSANLRVSGDLIAQGRNILAELDDIKKRAIFNGDKMVLHPNGKSKDQCSDIGRVHTCDSADGNNWSLATIEKK